MSEKRSEKKSETRSEKRWPEPPPPEQRHPLSNMVRDIALSLPDAWEDHPWGDIIFKVGDKMFASAGADSGGCYVKANPAELESLLQLPGISRAPYLGRYGWIVVEFDSEEQRPFIERLIHVSYELVRGKQRSKKKKASKDEEA